MRKFSAIEWVIIASILSIVFLMVAYPAPAESQGGWGSYETKYEYDSIRNQEKIIRLLEEHNRSCK